MVPNAFKSEIFPSKQTTCTGNPGMSSCVASISDSLSLEKLNPKQMLQRLPIALAHVKAKSWIRFLYQAKEITKEVYNNLINSINV